jgi:hypothetical protein
MPIEPDTEPVRTMVPPSAISGRAFCTVKRTLFTLRLKILSKCSSLTASSGTNS